MTLVEQINKDIIAAMKAKDEVSLRGLRSMKTALIVASTDKNAKCIEVNGTKQVDADSAIKVLTRLATQRKESADIYIKNNRPELAKIENDELSVIQKYLPQSLSAEEIEVDVRSILSKLDMPNFNAKLGRTLGELNKKYVGRIDAALASKIITSVINETSN